MFCKYNTINNVRILTGRAETIAHDEAHRERFDIAFARALGKLPVALELCIPFLKPNGLLVIPHGESYASEISRSQHAMKELQTVHQDSISYPLNKDIRFTALFFLKLRDTPERYPRKAGIPRKRPL